MLAIINFNIGGVIRSRYILLIIPMMECFILLHIGVVTLVHAYSGGITYKMGNTSSSGGKSGSEKDKVISYDVLYCGRDMLILIYISRYYSFTI